MFVYISVAVWTRKERQSLYAIEMMQIVTSCNLQFPYPAKWIYGYDAHVHRDVGSGGE